MASHAFTQFFIGPGSQLPTPGVCLGYPICDQRNKALVLEQLNEFSELCQLV